MKNLIAGISIIVFVVMTVHIIMQNGIIITLGITAIFTALIMWVNWTIDVIITWSKRNEQ